MRQRDAIASLAAALVLVVGMGFGRFAFTGLYPLMVTSGQISVGGGSYAAAANYAGYLVGALLTALLTRVSSHKLCLASVVATVVLAGLLSLRLPEWTIIAIRGLAGAASAISIVAATHWLIHDRDHHHGAPALFAGVGVGIVLSAELIAVSTSLGFSSFGIWAVLGLGALPLSIIAMALQARQERHVISAPMHPQQRMREASASIGPLRLVAVYGLAGFGYIITATYLPLLVRTAVSSIDPIHVWAIFGIGAVPSCFFWHRLSVRWGSNRSLMINLVIQAIGVALPAIHSSAAYMLSALLVGGTFMGTVTIAMPAARAIAECVRFNMLAVMTAAYGVGQILGPLLASRLYAAKGTFDTSLYIAAAALILAGVLCIAPRRAQQSASLTDGRLAGLH